MTNVTSPMSSMYTSVALTPAVDAPVAYSPPRQYYSEEIYKDVTIERRPFMRQDGHLFHADITLTTTCKDDQVTIKKDKEGAHVAIINGKSYPLEFGNLVENNELRINTGAGKDKITVADDVEVRVLINSGDGDDDIYTGGSDFAFVNAGNGNDTVRLGKLGGVAEGEAGDDLLIGGDGRQVSHLKGGSGTNLYQYNSMAFLHFSPDSENYISKKASETQIDKWGGPTAKVYELARK